MLRRLQRFTVFAMLAAVGLVAGCDSDNPTGNSGNDPVARTAMGSGDVGSGPFFFRADGPDGSGMAFLLRGKNLRYEDGSLTVDVVAINEGNEAAALPAVLTLSSIDPDTVTVSGAGNGETGAGASFDLEFENEDMAWDVGEESMPITLDFDVAQGVSIAFVARIDVGMMADGGSIGGTVFDDRDEDGLFDAEEDGVPGAMVELSGAGAGFTTRTMRTEIDGTYRFDGLDTGAYTVHFDSSPHGAPTTATEIQVLMTENAEGEVVDYLGADFGVDRQVDPPMGGMIEVGDFVEVSGRFEEDPYRIVAYEVDREHHERDDPSEVRGPVTMVDPEMSVLSVMGVHFDVTGLEATGGGRADDCQDRPALDFEVGERARVWGDGVAMAATDSTDTVYDATRVMCWNGDKEKVHGIVEEVERDVDGELTAFTVFGLRVEVTDRTDFDDDRHDNDDNDDNDGNDGMGDR